MDWWDITNPAHWLRSRRVQGLLIAALSVAASLLGYNLTPAGEGEMMGTGNQVLALAAMVWNQIGAFKATTSPRPF